MPPHLVSANVAVLRTGAWTGHQGRTGIDKRPVGGPVAVTRLGLAGDQIVNGGHGGLDQAVYAYAREDAAWWAAELGRDLSPGRFGENLSTQGVDVTGAIIGERWRVGTAVLQVTLPRIPCRVFAGFWRVPDLIGRFTRRGLPGAYLRVVEEGVLGAGDPIEVVDRPAHGMSIQATFRALTGAPELLSRLAGVPDLPAKLADRVAAAAPTGPALG